MLIYSPSKEMSPRVPNRIRKPSNAEQEARRYYKHEEMMMSSNTNKWTTKTGNCKRGGNNRFVTGTIIIPLLLVSCFSSMGCTKWPPNNDLSSSNRPAPPEADESPKTAVGSFGDRISQMFALLGPRRDHPVLMATEESVPSVSFRSFDPAAAAAANDLPDDQLESSEAMKGPPVYRSAPKQIIEVTNHESAKAKKESKPIEVVKKVAKLQKKASLNGMPRDLHSAAGKHEPRHTKSRKKHAYPSHYTYFGKYHEHRSVPAKGAWEFGYKRGNSKHTIEREEHGHKSHFKTDVKWKDKKGKGHHVFDYNHGDHKKHYAAAASQVTQRKSQQPAATKKKEKKSAR